MAAALIIGQAEREALAALRALAEREPIDVRTLAAESATPEGEARVRERMMRYTVDVPHGYRVTFSVETGHSVGTVRHLSMSLRYRGANATRTPLEQNSEITTSRSGGAPWAS